MNDKEIYAKLCLEQKDIPIFSTNWWMDAVCGANNWDVILINKGTELVAALPYYFINKGGRKIVKQPILTQTNGVWIKYPKNQKYVTKLSYEKEVINLLIDKLSESDISSYNQSYNYRYDNWLPFYWRGFEEKAKYTYVIENEVDIDQVYANIDSKTKNQIRKAEKILKIEDDVDVDTFYKVNSMTFERQGLKIPYSIDVVKRIYDSCKKRECVKIFSALDGENNVHASIFIVWDNETAYYIMGGSNPEYRKSDAMSLLIWKGIEFSLTNGLNFDFEGSMLEPIEKFFRSFGAKQKLYFNLSKEFEKTNILAIITRDIYEHYPFLRNTYLKVRGIKK
jgi:hypothetical protein